jgi:hypothetical protein
MKDPIDVDGWSCQEFTSFRHAKSPDGFGVTYYQEDGSLGTEFMVMIPATVLVWLISPMLSELREEGRR